MSRLRIVAYAIQPQAMVDDGDNLTPLPIEPIVVPAAEWERVVEKMAAALERFRADVESEE